MSHMFALALGQRVIIANTAQAELNGQQAKVIGIDPENPQRQHVEMVSSGKVLSILAEKLIMPGQQVTIVNTSDPELNGQQAEVVGLDPNNPQRQHVKMLGSQRVVSLLADKLVTSSLPSPKRRKVSMCSQGYQNVTSNRSTPCCPPTSSHLDNDSDGACAWFKKAFGSALPPEMTVLMLGPTGAGKTSFLNLLANFMVVQNCGADALNGKVKDFHDVKFENSLESKTVSKTSAATVYKMEMCKDFMLKIIDTPGFGDTRGMDFDKNHAKLIVNCINGMGHINAIVLVVSGRDCRMTAHLKYVLTEVCAILPQGARSNILCVFTNTQNPLLLNFDIDALSELVEHTVLPERQIFIENPFALWEKSTKSHGKIPGGQAQRALCRAFEDSAENLSNFFSAIASMPRLNTKDFEKLYKLRQTIESNTVEVLNKLAHSQDVIKQLQTKKDEVSRAANAEQMNEGYVQSFNSKRWVFKDADRHGTFCSARGCHSNCHAPCIMEKTMDNEKFKQCSAFYWKSTMVTIESAVERDELLRHMVDQEVSLHSDQDGGAVNKETVLWATGDFSFKGHSFVKGACVTINRSAQASKADLQKSTFPVQVTIHDTSDQDTCNKCGHDRQLHYHDEKMWVEEDYSQEVVDEDAKERFFEAKSLKEKKQEAMKGIQAQIEKNEREQIKLRQTLLTNVREFEGKGLSRNYALLLQSQRDLLQQHIDSTLGGENGADVSVLRSAHAAIQAQLDVVTSSLAKGSNPVEWAKLMLGLSKIATLADVEKKYKEESKRMHPDKHGGNPERMQQLNEAAQIMRSHLKEKKGLFAGWLGRAD